MIPVIVVLLAVAVIIAVIFVNKKIRRHFLKTPTAKVENEQVYGNIGEKIVVNFINRVLQKDDCFFTNVPLSYDGQDIKFDNLIVNAYGVFVIGVKNYEGSIMGEAEDAEWMKYSNDGYGNLLQREIENPILQARRQADFLASYLRKHGADVSAEGYVMLIQNNSPVESPYILASLADIDRAIHTAVREPLDEETIATVKSLISELSETARTETDSDICSC